MSEPCAPVREHPSGRAALKRALSTSQNPNLPPITFLLKIIENPTPPSPPPAVCAVAESLCSNRGPQPSPLEYQRPHQPQDLEPPLPSPAGVAPTSSTAAAPPSTEATLSAASKSHATSLGCGEVHWFHRASQRVTSRRQATAVSTAEPPLFFSVGKEEKKRGGEREMLGGTRV